MTGWMLYAMEWDLKQRSPYSPDIAPSVSYMFSHLQQHLDGTIYHSNDKAPQLTWIPKKKQRKTEDENREFKVEWTENFAFIQNLNGPPTCLICKEKLSHNKKSYLERPFTRKRTSFSSKYPTGDARKKAVEEFQKSQESSTSVFNNWMQSSTNINMARCVLSKRLLEVGNRTQTADT
ncbi:uncharacterized protein TNCV_2225811 [Trichonephila clavipes]|nr:uncharacterized protein TNCV_2225811 [Trichonephila clavipes]